ncbi:MAG: hypothetical protein KatS3mg114_0981 [Planctomycetaceae bacterium]|nr:MAG: hypothetical protein KatS3mg114_0981 [Planctomycetaceae bacterium]
MVAWRNVVTVIGWIMLAGILHADSGYHSLFNGQNLEGWDGNPDFWRVEDGCITGETTPEKPTRGNTFLIYRGRDFGDFELKLEYKIGGSGNSGVQYRSFEVPNEKWVIGGYQADIDSGDTYSGICYGERFRGILAQRGQETVIDDSHKPTLIASLGDSQEIQQRIRKNDWNEYHITARGYTFIHRINGRVTAIVHDEDQQQRRASGLIALQLHAGPPMKIQFRNLRIKPLETAQQAAMPRKVLFLAGRKSHGFGAHDHTAGCHLLARLLNASGLPIQAEVHELEKQGWPSADKLAAAQSIVIYADGGGGHPFNEHLDELAPLMARGVGLVCLHYGVEVPKGKSGDAFLEWTGGYFETHWSVNPHWTAHFRQLPDHPICRGVKPFQINDEWYYHMRFRDQMEGVTAILSDLPPRETLSRPDGPHSGNPHVRQAIERGEIQHVAWARERPDGGRGFGCTGGHVHWNWGHDQFRKLILNAIAWSAQVEVPPDGVPAGRVTVADLLQNHDEPIPADFNQARIAALLDEWNR